jgi:hypothetical protein
VAGGLRLPVLEFSQLKMELCDRLKGTLRRSIK